MAEVDVDVETGQVKVNLNLARRDLLSAALRHLHREQMERLRKCGSASSCMDGFMPSIFSRTAESWCRCHRLY